MYFSLYLYFLLSISGSRISHHQHLVPNVFFTHIDKLYKMTGVITCSFMQSNTKVISHEGSFFYQCTPTFLRYQDLDSQNCHHLQM